MTNDKQHGHSTHSIDRRSVISPPPPYTSIDDKLDQYSEVEKTVSKMQEVIETTYLMMQESQKRLVRLECSSQLLLTGLTQWMNNNNRATTSCSSSSSSTTIGCDYGGLLDTMATTVENLLNEAKASLDHTVSIPPPPPSPTININWALTPEQERRYHISEQNLDMAFKRLMDQVDDTTESSPTYHYHHHHHHYHHHQNDIYSLPVNEPRSLHHEPANLQTSLLTVPIQRVQSWFTSDPPPPPPPPLILSATNQSLHQYRLTALTVLLTSRLLLHRIHRFHRLRPSSRLYLKLHRFIFILRFIYHLHT